MKLTTLAHRLTIELCGYEAHNQKLHPPVVAPDTIAKAQVLAKPMPLIQNELGAFSIATEALLTRGNITEQEAHALVDRLKAALITDYTTIVEEYPTPFNDFLTHDQSLMIEANTAAFEPFVPGITMLTSLLFTIEERHNGISISDLLFELVGIALSLKKNLASYVEEHALLSKAIKSGNYLAQQAFTERGNLTVTQLNHNHVLAYAMDLKNLVDSLPDLASSMPAYPPHTQALTLIPKLSHALSLLHKVYQTRQ